MSKSPTASIPKKTTAAPATWWESHAMNCMWDIPRLEDAASYRAAVVTAAGLVAASRAT
jgi:hypothetical protein